MLKPLSIPNKPAITAFHGKYAFLSNFYPSPITFVGVFSTVEHAYQASKTMSLEERAAIMAAASPGQAKRLGQKCTLRSDWEDIKDDVMWLFVRAKFLQNEDLKEKLLATGNAQLQEGNKWGDMYWGVDLATGRGQNKLGKILMQVRDELRE